VEPVAVGQVGGETLMLMAGRLDADHHQLGSQLTAQLRDDALELGQPSPVGHQPHTVSHDRAGEVTHDDEPGGLGDIDPDQQHPPRIQVGDELEERRCPLAPDVGTMHHRPAPFC
jgi:hypothetical protein